MASISMSKKEFSCDDCVLQSICSVEHHPPLSKKDAITCAYTLKCGELTLYCALGGIPGNVGLDAGSVQRRRSKAAIQAMAGAALALGRPVEYPGSIAVEYVAAAKAAASDGRTAVDTLSKERHFYRSQSEQAQARGGFCLKTYKEQAHKGQAAYRVIRCDEPKDQQPPTSIYMPGSGITLTRPDAAEQLGLLDGPQVARDAVTFGSD